MNSLTQQLVDVDGARLEILRGGAGHPVICCQHPHSSNLGFQWYADHTSFIYVVMRGLGNSSPIREPGDLTYLQAAHDLEAVHRKLGIERWVVQGFSAGSQVALMYALTYHDSLAGLISISGFARGSRLVANPHSLCSPLYPDYQADLEALGEREIQRSPAVLLSSPDHYWAQVNPQAWGFFRGDTPLAIMPGDQLHDRLKAVFEEATLFEIEDRLNEIHVPTLVVGGRHDPIVPVEESIEVYERIPGSSMVVLEHSGHGAQGADEAIFKDTVLHFLSQLRT